ncbi:hypothetical protein BpHYR1_038553, partial [Brachionus plicatilis]
ELIFLSIDPSFYQVSINILRTVTKFSLTLFVAKEFLFHLFNAFNLNFINIIYFQKFNMVVFDKKNQNPFAMLKDIDSTTNQLYESNIHLD